LLQIGDEDVLRVYDRLIRRGVARARRNVGAAVHARGDGSRCLFIEAVAPRVEFARDEVLRRGADPDLALPLAVDEHVRARVLGRHRGIHARLGGVDDTAREIVDREGAAIRIGALAGEAEMLEDHLPAILRELVTESARRERDHGVAL